MPFYNTRFSTVVPFNSGEELLCDYLARRFTYHSVKTWHRLIGQGRLAINGETAGNSSRIKAGDNLSFQVLDHYEKPPPEGIKILSEKNGLLFVHKPAGIPVHRTGKVIFNTLVNWVRSKAGDEEVSPINRLDAETSGIVIFRRPSCTLFAEVPQAPWRKLYVAILRGSLPDLKGKISKPLGTVPESEIRCQMHPRTGGRRALSLYKVIGNLNGVLLVVAFPVTGRKHQLRAHFASAGAPVLGDKIYSLNGKYYIQRIERELNHMDWKDLGARHHLLHCFFTEFRDRHCGSISQEDWNLDKEFTRRFSTGTIKNWFNSNECARFLEEAGQITLALLKP